MTELLPILVGAGLLIFGRKLFWLFVGAVGFLVGLHTAPYFFETQSQWVFVIIGLVVGAVGALLAIFLQKAAVAVAGFLAGGYLVTQIVPTLMEQTELAYWVLFLVGGILGAILVASVFEWALIVLSSFLGAYMIVYELHLRPLNSVLLIGLLFMLGTLIQAKSIKRSSRSKGNSAKDTQT